MSESNRRKNARLAAWAAQNGECFYCTDPTWLPDMGFRFAMKELGHKTVALARMKRATLEHLVKKEFGGTISRFNTVMACADCNERRGDRGWLTHLMIVRAERFHNATIYNADREV